MISDDRLGQNSEQSFRALGICWMIYGILRIIAAVWLVSFSNTASMMFGALLNRVPDPFAMMNGFHFFYTLVIAWSVVCGVLGILGGLALAAHQKSGRILTLVAAFLSLCEIPLGVTLGIYSLIVLLPVHDMHASTVDLRDHASDLRGHPSTT